MQRFKSLQPRMGTAAGLSVLVLGLCLGQSYAAAKEPLLSCSNKSRRSVLWRWMRFPTESS